MIGRKIGLTSAAIQRQLSVDRPDFGILFDDMLYEGEEVRIPTTALLQPRIEGEIAFILDEDVTEAGLPQSRLQRAAGSVAAAFEIVDSAIADWKITLADTVADNASCGALVLARARTPLTSVDVRLAGMVMTEEDSIVSLGVGAASLGDPIAAFGWLANLAIEQGEPLRRGEIVLTGALGAMVPFVRGKRYRLEIAGLGSLIANAD
jgi:2-keto-4-pentenoate hydratase